MQAGLALGGRGAAVMAGVRVAAQARAAAGARGAQPAGGAGLQPSDDHEVPFVRRPYLAVSAMPNLDNKRYEIGTLVMLATFGGLIPEVFGTELGATSQAQGMVHWGVVVEQPMVSGTPSPVAIFGPVRVRSTGTIENGEWVRNGGGGAVAPMRNSPQSGGHIQRPLAALGWALEDAANDECVVFLMGPEADPYDQEWEWGFIVESFGANLPSEANTARDWGNVSVGHVGGATSGGVAPNPALGGYFTADKAMRLHPNGTPTAPALWIHARGASAATVAAFLNPNDAPTGEWWEWRCRTAQFGSAAGTRRMGMVAVLLNTAGEPAAGLYVRHSNAGNYTFVQREGGVDQNTIDSGVPAAVGEWHRMRMWIDGTALVECELDGELLGSLGVINLDLGCGVGASATTGSNGLYFDYMGMRGKRRPIE